MSSATFACNSDASGPPGFCPAPPPPPPPPGSGQLPATRINTTIEPSMSRRPQIKSNDLYEPPAAIQNAMMTKDKKPFTYTPGMGGKLDLSQIRSPRMARRVAKNANDEGIEGPVKSPLAAEQPRPVSTGANLYIQPQVAVPVFPTGPPVLPQGPRTVQIIKAPPNNAEKIESTMPTVKIQPNVQSPARSPDTPTTPTLVQLTKAPTPWLQNKNKPQEELPEWAKRDTNGASPYTPPDFSPNAQTMYVQTSPLSSPQPPKQAQPKVVQQMKPQSPTERVVPMRVEDRPSVFTVKNEPGHHQLKQSTPHHQQRWGQPSGPGPQPQSPPRVVSNPNSPKPQQQPGTFIVPMVVEGSNDRSSTIVINPYQQSSPQQQGNRNVVQRAPVNQQESGPVQSRFFKVLQKITDTDSDDVDPEQLRKLQLTEEDKILMNKFKEQVDGDHYLHQEEDPRYRGAAIPSRAFRYLQNMTDSNEMPSNANVPRAVNSALKRQNRNSRSFEEAQAGLPPSEQQVPEPKKYTGGAIPSRSFRILQAMTTPESMAMQDCRQADFACQVSSSMMPQGNQQALFIPRFPHPVYWAYCPMPYPNLTNTHYSPPIAYVPFYDHNFHSTATHDVPLEPRQAEVSTESPYWIGGPVETVESTGQDPKEQQPSQNDHTTEDSWNRIESAPRNSEACSMNILHEEDSPEVDLSNNDENLLSENEELGSDVSSSSDTDSDSYLAYSTGLNQGQGSKDKSESSEDKQVTDCESYVEEEEHFAEKESDNVPEEINLMPADDVLVDETDENVSETVNVSFPLKFKSREPENVESNVEEAIESTKSSNDVCVHLKIDNNSNTSVDFTLRKQARPKSWCPEGVSDDFWTSKTIVGRRAISPGTFDLCKRAIDEETCEDEDVHNNSKHLEPMEVQRPTEVPQFEIIVEDEENINKKAEERNNNNKYLLTVQNSREETDDDDSGVTSDMSRLISEVDTDSECAPARKINTYSRTQTHSRLFKLLNEDLKIVEDSEKPQMKKSDRRNRLSLPLKQSNGFNQDCSSDLTSSDCSPVQEPTWRPLQELQRSLETKDRYYKTWKEPKDSKESESVVRTRVSPLKCNVLCPRIKSSKSVPRALQGRPNKAPVPSRGKYERC